MCLHWRVLLRPLLVVLYVLFVIIVVPLLIADSVKDGFTRKGQLILIGGLFVLCAIPISIWQIAQHTIHYTQPQLQRHIIRILWMVPIYALNALLCLIYPSKSIYMDSIRECYEAYVIYNFMKYLLNYLNLEMDLERALEFNTQTHHFIPCCCLSTWRMGREFVHNCKHGILQYTVVRPLTTIIACICQLNHVYGEGEFRASVAFPYLVFINNCSQSIAMYCLALFYRATRNELRAMKPLPKFFCIKAVIFFSFFQSVIIYFLVYYDIIKDIFDSNTSEFESQLELSTKLQNFLICIEMFLAALAHHYSFSHQPYVINIPVGLIARGSINGSSAGGGGTSTGGTSGGGALQSWYYGFLTMLDLSDVRQDVSEHLGEVGSSLSRRFRGRAVYDLAPGSSRTCDMNISGSEREFLVPHDGGGNNLLASQCYQSGLYYSATGATGATGVSQLYPGGQSKASGGSSGTIGNPKYGALDSGISIVRPKVEKLVDTPNEGAPPKEINIFNQFPSTKALNLTLSKTPSYENLISLKNETDPKTNAAKQRSSSRRPATEGTSNSESSSSQRLMQRSESNGSDWLSTPDDELGIVVKGISSDNININPNRHRKA
ncbi:transmembrane protein 184C [Anopheles maculipalpis]|uniref:transmembrane protein 184C n=1 Tax=Anopheles maculipalpis TaxID=1496333 RepID=UPI002158FB51|nr:transmembrane protein 184C [Anopheles maculipalpis]